MVGYMVTFTTYGTWLQGDRRGFVKNASILPANRSLENANESAQKNPSVILSKNERSIIYKAIIEEAERIRHRLHGIAVCSNHVHIVAEPGKETIGKIVSRYKNIARTAIGRKERIWTRGFDKRFCFAEQDFRQRIEYVKNHNSVISEIGG